MGVIYFFQNLEFFFPKINIPLFSIYQLFYMIFYSNYFFGKSLTKFRVGISHRYVEYLQNNTYNVFNTGFTEYLFI